MPGPVSQSYEPAPSLNRRWREEIESAGLRYFVLKAEDVFDALREDDLELFNGMLRVIEEHRRRKGKPLHRSFLVFARHWKGASRIKSLMEDLLGVKIGGPEVTE